MAAVAGISEAQAWQVLFETDLELAYEAGRMSTQEFYEAFCAATGTRPDREALLAAAGDIFELNPAIVPLVAHLHAARYPLGILSNTNEVHWQFVARGRYAVVQDFFSVHALSFELQAMKPASRIYTAAARLAGVEPEEIFFMDDREDNVAAACEAGFDAIVFHNARQLASALRERGIRWNY